MLASDFIRKSKKSLFAADFFGVVKPWTDTHTERHGSNGYNDALYQHSRVHFSGLLSQLCHDFVLLYKRQEKLHYDMKQDSSKRCCFQWNSVRLWSKKIFTIR